MNEWSIADAFSYQKYDLIALELEPALYDTLSKQPNFASSVQEERKHLMQSHGLFVPAIRIKRNAYEKNRYVIRIRGQRVGEGILHPPFNFSNEGEEGIPGIHPVTNEPGVWTEGEGQTAQALLLSHLRAIMEKKSPDLLTYETAARWWQQARSHVPNLIKELEKHGFTVGLMWQVMRKLLKKRIPLHPFEDLLETIMEYYIVHPPHGYAPPDWSHSHPDDIVKYIAAQKKRRLPPAEQSLSVVRHLKR